MATMDHTDKRRSARRTITHTVFMATGVSAPLKCQMIDISETGARLRINDPRAAPQEFLIVLNHGLRRWCQVRWRSDSEIGIQFVEPPQSLKPRT